MNNKEMEKFTTSRRDFLKGAGAITLGMGMMPVLSLFGLQNVKAE